ncbi:MAG TPA: hypothetical protein DCZ92_07695 [Elusimicrobia bacterium]|nr:hypothetical protein [Elusimicrobiota bacterium]
MAHYVVGDLVMAPDVLFDPVAEERKLLGAQLGEIYGRAGVGLFLFFVDELVEPYEEAGQAGHEDDGHADGEDAVDGIHAGHYAQHDHQRE